MSAIPSKDRKEWRQLLNGEIEINFSNFFYQAKILQAREQVKNDKISIEDAIDEIYELTTQYCEIEKVSDDIAQIFGEKETISIKPPVITENITKTTEKVVEENKIVSDNIIENNKGVLEEKNKVITEKKQDIIPKTILVNEEKTPVNLSKEREEARKEIEKRLEEERKRRENDKKRNALIKKAPIKKPVDAKFVPKHKTKKNKPAKKAKPKNKSFWDNIFGK